jgi:hypothetical protein
MTESLESFGINPEALKEDEDIFSNVDLPDSEIDKILRMGKKLDANSVKHLGTKIELTGPAKIGKTSWALDADNCRLTNPNMQPWLKWLIANQYVTDPRPVFLIDTEKRTNRLYNRFPNSDITIFCVRYPDKKRPYREDPVLMLRLVWNILSAIHKRYKTGTIVFDTHSYINRRIPNYIQQELIARGAANAEFGEYLKLFPQDYSVRNDIWDYILGLALDMPQHFVFISRQKEVWGMIPGAGKDGKDAFGRTGEFESQHFKELPYEVDMELDYDYKKEIPGSPISKMNRVMNLEEFAWSGVEPEQMTWVAPTFTDVLNYASKFSHHEIIRQHLQEIKNMKIGQKNVLEMIK